jgi:hypothetical protein
MMPNIGTWFTCELMELKPIHVYQNVTNIHEFN